MKKLQPKPGPKRLAGLDWYFYPTSGLYQAEMIMMIIYNIDVNFKNKYYLCILAATGGNKVQFREIVVDD